MSCATVMSSISQQAGRDIEQRLVSLASEKAALIELIRKSKLAVSAEVDYITRASQIPDNLTHAIAAASSELNLLSDLRKQLFEQEQQLREVEFLIFEVSRNFVN